MNRLFHVGANARGRKLVCCQISLFLLAVFLGAQLAHAENSRDHRLNYSVEGYSKITTFDQDGAAVQVSKAEFIFHTRDCNWYRESHASIGDAKSHLLLGCDNTNIWIVSKSTGGRYEGRQFNQIARIQLGNIPEFGSHGALCWLTFVSRCVLTPKIQEFRPVYKGYGANPPQKVKLVFNNENGFPVRMDFLGEWREGEYFTNASFAIDKFMEYDGHQLPSLATLLVYRSTVGQTGEGAPTNRVYLIEKQELVATRFSSGARGSYVPDLDNKPTLISDERLDLGYGAPGGVKYLSSDWITVEEAKKTAEYAKYSGLALGRPYVAQSSDSSKTTSNRSLVSFILYVTLAAPIVIGIWLWLIKNKQN